MIQIAELQKQAVSKEADRLENMPEWKSRVLGLSKGEII